MRTMKLNYFLIGLVAIFLSWIVFTQSKPVIRGALMVTHFPLYDALRFIAPSEAQVEMLLPLGKDAHTFEPTPQDMIKIAQSKHFFYVAQGLDQWVLSAAKMHNHVTDLSHVVHWIEGGCEHEEHEHEEHEDEMPSLDPHYWLSISNQKATARAMAEVLFALYPQEHASIEAKLDAYYNRLDALDAAYASRLQGCEIHKIYVTHDAFGYLSRRYHFEVKALLGLSPEAQVGPEALKHHIDALLQHDAKVIFFESFISDLLAQTISRETHARVDVLHTLATATDINQTYETLMLENLEKLSKAMMCP